MLKLRIECMRFQNIYVVVHNNSSDWLKVGKEKKKIGLNSNLTKFGANLSFNHHLSPNIFFSMFFLEISPPYAQMGVLVLCFPYFMDIFIVSLAFL